MKTRISPAWLLGLVGVSALALGYGLNETLKRTWPRSGTTSQLTSDLSDPTSMQEAAPGLDRAQAAERLDPRDRRSRAAPNISSGLRAIVNLSEAGLEDSVLLGFIANFEGSFDAGPDQLIYLSDLGVSAAVVTTLLRHDARRGPLHEPPLPPAGALGPGFQTVSRAKQDDSGTQPPNFSISLGPVSQLKSTIASSVVAPQPKSPASESTITNELPSDPEPELDLPSEVSTEQAGFYPVREAHAVKLTDPIIFLNAEPRAPNLVLIGRLR